MKTRGVVPQPHPPLTWTGVVRCVVVPSPSWPLPFHPQANRQVVSFRPKVCSQPAATAVTPLLPIAPFATRVGVVRSVVVPSPS